MKRPLLRDDDRAVTVQIGAVLLLGFLVIALSLYQATVVPAQNEQIEFRHNQRVQSDLQQLRNSIIATGATGSAAPVGVKLGTRYPSRVVAVNPAPPSGTLSTSPLGKIRIRNATADDGTTLTEDYPETADFWDGDPHNYSTKSLVYRPNYANYHQAPTTVYENGVVYNRFAPGNVTLTGQPIVSGNRISLVALSGELSRSGTGTLVLDPRAVSVSTRTISVTNASAGKNVSIFLPSGLDAQTWTDLLNQTDEYDPPGAPATDGRVYRVENRTGGVVLYFEPGVTYQLKLSKVGVGTDVGSTEEAYLTSVEDLTETPFTSRTYPFVVESRDKYNNPVGTSVLAASQRTTIPDGVVVEPGRYRYQYPSPSTAGPDWVNVTYRTGAGDPEYDVTSASFDGSLSANVQYDVDVQAGGGGGAFCVVGSSNNPNTLQINNLQKFTADSKNDQWGLKQVQVQDKDGDDDLKELKFEITDGGGVVRATLTISLSGGKYQKKNLDIQPDDSTYDVQTGDTYTLTATVCDADGNSKTETRQTTA